MPIEKTAYRYLYDENKNFEHDISIIYLGRKIKYYELFSEIEKVAKSLKQIGVSKGDVVTICMPNTPESAYLFYACSKIGAIADFIDPRENEEGLEKYLSISNPKHLVLLDLCFDNFKNLIEKRNIKNVVLASTLELLPYPIMCGVQFKEKLSNLEMHKNRKLYIEKSNANIMTYRNFIKNGKKYNKKTEKIYQKDTLVAIVHTGGTTGVPKGVLLSNDNLNELTSQVKNSNTKHQKAKELKKTTRYYDNKEFNSDDAYDISRGTDKEDELFDYANIPSYMKTNKNTYNEKDKDNYDFSR